MRHSCLTFVSLLTLVDCFLLRPPRTSSKPSAPLNTLQSEPVTSPNPSATSLMLSNDWSSGTTRDVRLHMSDDEWYSPPTPSPQPAAHPKKTRNGGIRISSDVAPRIDEIEAHVELEEFLHADDDRLSVVFFHSNFCKTCKKVGRLFDRLALSDADWFDTRSRVKKVGSLRLAKVECGGNMQLCRSLGVTKLPTFHLYKRGFLLTRKSCLPNNFTQVLDAIKYYKTYTPPDAQLESDLLRGSKLLEQTGLLDSVRASVSSTSVKSNEKPSI